MTTHNNESDKATPLKEQLLYADVLSIGMWSGIAIMIITYILYVTGIIQPHVDMSLVVANWDKGVNEYMRLTNSPDGWSWVALLGTGDFLNFIGMALLAVLTIVCFLILLKGYVVRKNYTFATICAVEVLVLALAASGIFGSGGH
ncbi:MAG: DUF1634 domain-containing protein [Desulfonatronovibrionaceae bacterium]